MVIYKTGGCWGVDDPQQYQIQPAHGMRLKVQGSTPPGQTNYNYYNLSNACMCVKIKGTHMRREAQPTQQERAHPIPVDLILNVYEASGARGKVLHEITTITTPLFTSLPKIYQEVHTTHAEANTGDTLKTDACWRRH